MEHSTPTGIIIVLTGLFEIFFTPAILIRFGSRLSPIKFESVLRTIRISGLIVVVVGLFLLFGHRNAMP